MSSFAAKQRRVVCCVLACWRRLVLGAFALLLPLGMVLTSVEVGGGRAAEAQVLTEPHQRIVALLGTLRQLADDQRGALSRDALDLISEVTLSAERLLNEAAVVSGSLEESLAADVRGALGQVESSLENLIAQLRTGSAAVVQNAAQEANRVVANASASLQEAVGSTRPILANAERIGSELVLRTESAVSTLVLRIAAALALLSVIIAMAVVVARRKPGVWAGIGVLGTMALTAVAVFVFAPKISWAFSEETRIPDPAADCRLVQAEGRTMMAALGSGTPVEPALAERVRDAAARCHLLSPNAVEAATAERYLTGALEVLGASLVCKSSAQCVAGKVCDTTSGECLPLGVYCELPADCSEDKECDRGKRRCVSPTKYDCAPPERPCQASQVCIAGRCTSPTQADLGGPCAPVGEGICGAPDAGRWELNARGERVCVKKVQARPEECNALDDNCNGQIDDGVRGVGAGCTASAARGECRKGKTTCERGALVCKASTGKKELCFNDQDEDCDGLLNNGCPGEKGASELHHCGSFGSGCKVIGGKCPDHRVRDTVDMAGPVDGGLRGWWKWTSSDPKDCRAEVCCESKDLFKGGDWTFTVWSKPDVRRVP